MKSYPSYKDSGVEWIGEIPNHWDTSKIGRHFELGRGRVISNIEIQDNIGEYPVYSSQTKNDGVFGKINSYDFDGEYVIWTTDGVYSGTVSYRNGKFNTTNVCGMMSPKNIPIHLPYIPYLLNLGTKYYVRLDINPKLMNNMMSDIPFSIPPLPEQTQIVSFLDTKTKKIDELIEKTKQKIKLLKEKRTSLINHCVTKGLNPNVEMKDSGVEWIGEIPKDWGIIKGKYILKILTGNYPKDLKENLTGISFFKVDDLNNTKQNYFIDSSQLVVKEDENLNPLPKNIILFPKRGMTIFTNKVVISKVRSYIDPNLMGVRIFDNSDIKFVLLCIKNRGLSDICDSSTIPQINNKHIYPLLFPFPPLLEQTQIVEYLDEQTQKIDSTIEKETQRIELLKEYRQSLISEVVTGKVDVRELIFN